MNADQIIEVIKNHEGAPVCIHHDVLGYIEIPKQQLIALIGNASKDALYESYVGRITDVLFVTAKENG